MSLGDLNQEGFKSGFIALIGRPNVGKSTLINKFIGEKIAITSPIAQTTRNRLKVILTNKKSQIIFVDTPGIHKPHHLLGERLVQSAKRSIGEVDAVLVIFEANYSPGRGDAFILNLIRNLQIPVIIALNKYDLVTLSQFKERKKEYLDFFEGKNWPVVCCSALTGEGCDELINQIEEKLPFGPQLYPSHMTCDHPEKFLMAEFIREQVLINTREEVPHSVAVSIDKIEDIPSKKRSKENSTTGILATICVEKKSQKGILIGKGGSMLKKIGQESRLQIQTLINGNVYLELFVKVVPDWRSKSSRLNEFGYEGS
ncbi:GTPase Era [Prochlorococcus marinus]|uniref:GTPase Era n=1 Tax=Prochlorococcus marinus XMU1408 TaxID=2213228 RepID=A0A318R240_PROMR|nr:GTPase Era [Prochlorococcus marinus]MBW3042462.1 GTPase Era [Prochlorococcus marinus str. XMU1408]PYE01197.1 GTPase Era [Prochlorococcus marinus XMU1408]